LHEALERAGISPDDAYITNVVKDFKFVERGKRRIHKKPTAIEIRACKSWLDAEIEVVRPALIVALGATAAPDSEARRAEMENFVADLRVVRRAGRTSTTPRGRETSAHGRSSRPR
jgi:uracil-DNA glycosylase family 4